MLDSDYPYTAMDGICQYDASKIAATISSYVSVTPSQPDQLKAALANQPVAISIDYHNLATRYYKAGVITSETCLNQVALSHSVLAVGYGTDRVTGLDYFLVKNSFGVTWGELGFAKFARESGDGPCGINIAPKFAII